MLRQLKEMRKAIIGYVDGDNIVGALLADDFKLERTLKQYFNSFEKLKNLVKEGCWEFFILPQDNIFYHFCLAYPTQLTLIPIDIDNCYIVKGKDSNINNFESDILKVENGMLKVSFDDFSKIWEQDINALYLFSPRTGKWFYFDETGETKTL